MKKIDKIIFSCSPYFAPFWNLQSRIWKTKMGIDPVCLYFSDNKKGMSEEFGEVILKEIDPKFGKDGDIIQVTMSKFFHPTTQENLVWMIGDIDMFPLQTKYFLEDYDRPVHGQYMHFNMAGIVPVDTFLNKGYESHGGGNLAGHYHIATGKTFKDTIFHDKNLSDTLEKIVFGTRYGRKVLDNNPIHKIFWCAEEDYTSEKIWEAFKRHEINLLWKTYDNKMNRIDRAFWNHHTKKYNYPWQEINEQQFNNNLFVDIHCHRPFHEQEEDLIRILNLAKMI